jgi:hypothetical protein
MLKLVALPLVNQIACTRDVLIEKLRDVDRGDFVVTIGGRDREDDEVKRQVTPVLQGVLRARIGSLNHDLEAYGVDVVG